MLLLSSRLIPSQTIINNSPEKLLVLPAPKLPRFPDPELSCFLLLLQLLLLLLFLPLLLAFVVFSQPSRRHQTLEATAARKKLL